MSLFLLRSAQTSAALFKNATKVLDAAKIAPQVVTITTANSAPASADVEKFTLSEQSKSAILGQTVQSIKIEGADVDKLKAAGSIAAAPLDSAHLKYILSQLSLHSQVVQTSTETSPKNPTYPNLSNITAITSVVDSWDGATDTIEQLQYFKGMATQQQINEATATLKSLLQQSVAKAKQAAGAEAFTLLVDNSGELTPVTNQLIQELVDEVGAGYNAKTVQAAVNDLLLFPEKYGAILGTQGAACNYSKILAGLGGGFGYTPVQYVNGSVTLNTAFQQTGDNPTALLVSVVKALRGLKKDAEAQKLEGALKKAANTSGNGDAITNAITQGL